MDNKKALNYGVENCFLKTRISLLWPQPQIQKHMTPSHVNFVFFCSEIHTKGKKRKEKKFCGEDRLVQCVLRWNNLITFTVTIYKQDHRTTYIISIIMLRVKKWKQKKATVIFNHSLSVSKRGKWGAKRLPTNRYKRKKAWWVKKAQELWPSTLSIF